MRPAKKRGSIDGDGKVHGNRDIIEKTQVENPTGSRGTKCRRSVWQQRGSGSRAAEG